MKTRVAEVIITLTPDVKASPLLTLIEVFKKLPNFGTGVTFWEAMDNSTADQAELSQCVVHMLQCVVHGAGIERINKGHQMVQTSGRASFGSNLNKAIFAFLNLCLLEKLKCSFRDFCSTVLTDEDSEEVLEELDFNAELNAREFGRLYGCEDDALPAVREGEDEEWDEEDEDEVMEGEDDLSYVLPDGFRAVDRPGDLLKTTNDIKDMYVYLLFNTGWEYGVVKSYKAQRRQNYNILFEDGLRGSMLELSNYYSELDGPAEPDVGAWQYLKKVS